MSLIEHNPAIDKSRGKSRLVQVGDALSAWIADLFAHPYMQIGVILFCIAWFAFRLSADLLTLALSILAITLTQMVLNSQKERECDDRRRDIALHAKIDELLIAMKGARDEMAGIEELEEAQIVELKEQAEGPQKVRPKKGAGPGPALVSKTGSRGAA